MSRPNHPVPMLLAPGASSGTGSLRLPAQGEDLPAVDDHIVVPETREEMLNGRRLTTQAAREPHATHHVDLGAILYTHVAPGWRVAIDMLTRSGLKSDFAPDVSIYPAARDPKTHGRQLEELAFEIVSRQDFSVATEKAAVLAERGVRRVICIVLKTRCVHEWSTAAHGWIAQTGALSDRCFVRDIPIRALLDAAVATSAVAEGLLAQRNPVIERALAEREALGETRGKARGKADSLLTVLTARGLVLDETTRSRIESCQDTDTLTRWIIRAATAPTVDAVFADT